jgi:hypothetical protein
VTPGWQPQSLSGGIHRECIDGVGAPGQHQHNRCSRVLRHSHPAHHAKASPAAAPRINCHHVMGPGRRRRLDVDALYEIPVPGALTVALVPPGPTLTRAPRPPIEADSPRLPMFNRTPWARRTPRRNRKGIVRMRPTACGVTARCRRSREPGRPAPAG